MYINNKEATFTEQGFITKKCTAMHKNYLALWFYPVLYSKKFTKLLYPEIFAVKLEFTILLNASLCMCIHPTEHLAECEHNKLILDISANYSDVTMCGSHTQAAIKISVPTESALWRRHRTNSTCNFTQSLTTHSLKHDWLKAM